MITEIYKKLREAAESAGLPVEIVSSPIWDLVSGEWGKTATVPSNNSCLVTLRVADTRVILENDGHVDLVIVIGPEQDRIVEILNPILTEE